MGLTKNEWITLKAEYPIESDLEESEIEKVDEYFNALYEQKEL